MSDPLNLFFGEPERGAWCERCNLPSAIRVPFNTANSEGVGGEGFLTICLDCAERSGNE